MKAIEALNGQNNLFTVGDQDFEAKILGSSLPMVVDFTAGFTGISLQILSRFAKCQRSLECR